MAKQWEHDGNKSASKIEVTVRSCYEKQFEKKKTLREALKFFDFRVSVRRQFQSSYKKSYDLITCLHCLVLWKLRNLETRVKFRIEFIMVEKSNQKKIGTAQKDEFRDTALRNAGSWSRKR